MSATHTPTISPLSFTSISKARGAFDRPGISIILPAIMTTKPAPAESETSVIRSVQPVGAQSNLGLSESEYYVFAMQTGSAPNPHFTNCSSFSVADSLNSTPSAP